VVQDDGRRAAWHNEYDFAGVRGRIERGFELFAREGVETALLLGDLAHDGDLASLRDALAPSADALVVGGNHDGARPTERLAEAGLVRPRLPGWRARSAGGGVGIAGLRVLRRARGSWAATRPPALATWGERTVLLASHFPVLSRADHVRDQRLPYAGDLVNRARLEAPLAARRAPTVVLCGHLHVRDSFATGAVLQLACGALIEPPFEATILRIEPDRCGGLRLERSAYELGRAPERRNPRLAPADETWRFTRGRGWRT